MLILMISIAVLILVSVLYCLRYFYNKDRGTYERNISEDMRITFPEAGSLESVPVLSDEMRHLIRSRCFDRGTNTGSSLSFTHCSNPSRNRENGDGTTVI
jgi:hypothetical protein